MRESTKKPLIIAFGSQVSGQTRTESDFDVAVLSEKPLTLAQRSRLSLMLSKKLKINEDKIDLVDLKAASPILQYEISRKGKLILGSEFDFIRFKVRAWKMYQDTEKFRRLREQMLKKHVKGIHTQKT